MPTRVCNLKSWKASHKEALPRIAHIARSVISVTSTLVLIGVAIPLEAHADAFGQCAHRRNLEEKIAACIQAAKSTSYPWILQWVHRELARSQRERGELQEAIISFERSLAAEEREEVRREMEQLTLLAPQGEGLQFRAAAGRQR
jgi:hypothetical protein